MTAAQPKFTLSRWPMLPADRMAWSVYIGKNRVSTGMAVHRVKFGYEVTPSPQGSPAIFPKFAEARAEVARRLALDPRVTIGPRMSAGDYAVIVHGEHTEHYLGTGHGGTVHFYGHHITLPRGKMSKPYASVEDARLALWRNVRRFGGDVAAALQATACPE